MEIWNPMVPELLVTNYKTSLTFYTDVLGFSIRYERKEPDFAYLDLERVQLMIEQIENNSWQSGKMEYPFGRGINFQIELTDISGIYDSLKSRNYALFKELKENWYQAGTERYGQKEFLVKDPDGYLLRFCQYLGKKGT